LNSPGGEPGGGPPDVQTLLADRHLWVVIEADVLHAKEACPFGARVDNGKIKHSNLTGGGRAFAAGEVLSVEPHIIVVSGQSGRYRISAAEFAGIVAAFKASGYDVWCMGYNTELGKPYMFHEKDPEWVP